MKTRLRWTLLPGAFMVLACQDGQPSEDLRNDLALIDAAVLELELAPRVGENATVVSAAEEVTVPGMKPVATPTRKRAPKAPPPESVEAAAEGPETVDAPEVVTVAASNAPTAVEDPAPEAAPAVRPQPIEPRYPVGGGAIFGTDREGDIGGVGGIGVVIRGGRTGRDPCAIHVPRRAPPRAGVLINDRIPVTTTFPRR